MPNECESDLGTEKTQNLSPTLYAAANVGIRFQALGEVISFGFFQLHLWHFSQSSMYYWQHYTYIHEVEV